MKHFQFNTVAVRLNGGRAARQFFAPIFSERRHEIFIAALCDEQLRLVQLVGIPGAASSVELSLQRIIRLAVSTEDCVGVILAHNHPSGDAKPSDGDFAFTRRFNLAAEALDLTVVDHIIFGGDLAFSFREHGYL